MNPRPLGRLMRLMLVGGVAAVTGMVGVASAQAGVPKTLATIHQAAVAGPALAGARVVWAQGSEKGAWTVRAAGGGRRPQVLARLPTPAPAGAEGAWHWAAIRASGQLIAVLDDAVRVDDAHYGDIAVLHERLLAAPVGGTFSALDDVCGGSRYDGSGASFVAAGRYVAAIVGCATPDSGGGSTLRVHDIVAGGPPIELPATGIGTFALAGHLLAWTERDATTSAVRFMSLDLRTGSRRLLWQTTRRVRFWDLRADGALALATGGALEQLGWVDPAGAWHALPGHPFGPNSIRGREDPLQFVGRRIALVLRRTTADDPFERLAVISTSGAVRTVASFAGQHSRGHRLGGFGFDGARLTWADQARVTTIRSLRLAP